MFNVNSTAKINENTNKGIVLFSVFAGIIIYIISILNLLLLSILRLTLGLVLRVAGVVNVVRAGGWVSGSVFSGCRPCARGFSQ